MTDFQFGFWAWLGKVAADFAIWLTILAVIFVIALVATIYEVFIQPPIRRWRGLCPRCGGAGKNVHGPFQMVCMACGGTGKFEPKKALKKTA